MNPQVIFESGQFSSILSMVSKGLGVSIVPAMALEKRPGCRFVALTDERATRTIGAIVLKGRSQTRISEAFLDYVTG
jgi:LysR family hydrogen peroxide-inducible transcriptional activator